ncbi:hypothetical protein J7K91_00665 [bacterium]|nr:hypothetical protein [bacterium]
MNYLSNWGEILAQALQKVFGKVIGFLPELIGGLIVFIVGLIIASGLEKIVERIVSALKIDAALERAGVKEVVERAGYQLNSGRFLGKVVYWIIIIAFLIAVADIWHLEGVSDFLSRVVGYLPNVFVAVLIVFLSVLAADLLRGIVKGSVSAANLKRAQFLGNLCWWVVFIFGILSALLQLGVATTIINSIVIGIIAMFALAGGIALGLGGKEYAQELMAKLKDILEK